MHGQHSPHRGFGPLLPLLVITCSLSGPPGHRAGVTHADDRQTESVTTPVSQRTPEAEREIVRLEAIWADWRQRIKTCRITGWKLQVMQRNESTAIPRDTFLSLVEDTFVPIMSEAAAKQTELTLERLDSLTAALLPNDLQNGSLGRWEQFSMTGALDDYMTTYTRNNEKRVMVRKDGKEQEYISWSRQANLRPTASRLFMEKLDTFLHLPDLAVLTRLEAGEETRRVLLNGDSREGFRLEYAAQSGFVYRDTRHIAPSWYVPERIQEAPFDTSEGIPFPRVCATVRYHKHVGPPLRVRSAELYLVDSVTLNLPVTEEDFALSVPSGTAIVEYTQTKEGASQAATPGPVARRVTQPVPDVLAASSQEGFAPPPRRHTPAPMDVPSAERRLGLLGLLLTVNAILLVLASAWWLAARRR
ncbi:hypothetical protein Mal4_01330 [Maioricimonas rarisocia]|uniref:Uncharacterized protein n=1 Tax=Maioricimonas rarisocia TaxID=2528026 RepID=A0A517Z030_9PLAN|nr:hypothetical protein [Maioricimonas rarisocia]QDU35851.1 hypothetical protein Mal4_01330 [Maioricimonas rarisocia]